MKQLRWQFYLGVVLAVLSGLLYLLHYTVFRDARHIFIYLVGDIAFLPLEVLLVTLIIHRLLLIREKRATLQKLNMVIGAFFQEMGTALLRTLAEFDGNRERIQSDLLVSQTWSGEAFRDVAARLGGHRPEIDPRRGDLERLRSLLLARRDFVLRLLQNPNLLEHEAFTDVLWAVSHLTEELGHRGDLRGLPEGDLRHLAEDMKRAYVRLLTQWIAYMRHLREDYPYLFSLALRTNPFDPAAKVEVG